MTIITTTMASLIYSLNGGTYYGTVKKSISKFIIKEVLDIILINQLSSTKKQAFNVLVMTKINIFLKLMI